MADDEQTRRDWPSLHAKLCNCGGPQPSLDKTRADEHMTWCLYRIEVEGPKSKGEGVGNSGQ